MQELLKAYLKLFHYNAASERPYTQFDEVADELNLNVFTKLQEQFDATFGVDWRDLLHDQDIRDAAKSVVAATKQ